MSGTEKWRAEVEALRARKPRGILFLCVANSARSQVAEGLARHLAGPETRIFSAGSRPGRIHPLALEVLAEIGIDGTGQFSKGLEVIPVDQVDTVITLCAEEFCPTWLHQTTRLHWGLPDPAILGDSMLEGFRLTRDELLKRLTELFIEPTSN